MYSSNPITIYIFVLLQHNSRLRISGHKIVKAIIMTSFIIATHTYAPLLKGFYITSTVLFSHQLIPNILFIA